MTDFLPPGQWYAQLATVFAGAGALATTVAAECRRQMTRTIWARPPEATGSLRNWRLALGRAVRAGEWDEVARLCRNLVGDGVVALSVEFTDVLFGVERLVRVRVSAIAKAVESVLAAAVRREQAWRARDEGWAAELVRRELARATPLDSMVATGCPAASAMTSG
jgi:hypothetical protein